MTQSNEAKLIIVAADDGFAMTDVVILQDGKVIKQIAIPSRARPGLHNVTAIAGGKQDDVVSAYETQGASFTVGDFSDSESARFDEYPFSDMNRVIVHHALRVAGLGGQKVKLATGLPLSKFYNGGLPNEQVIGRKNASIRIPVRPADDSETADIVHHETFPEGLAAWVDYAVNEDGTLRPGVDVETACIIDIGGRTTDIAVVLPGRRIDHARSGSADIGVLDVIQAIGVALEKTYSAPFPLGAIDAALRTKKIKVWGKDVDISDVFDAAVKTVLDRILREINRRLGAAFDVEKMIIVGGGAHVFGKAVTSHPNVYIPQDPEFANARGFAKYMELAS